MRQRAVGWLLFAMLAANAHAQRVITTITGTDWVLTGDGVPAVNAPLGAPSWIVTDNGGNPVFVDSLNCVVARIGATGTLSVLAGNGFCGFNTGQGGPATSAALNATSMARTSIVSAPVAYAGLVSGLVGLYQVNLSVPSGVPAIPFRLSLACPAKPALRRVWR